MMATKNRSLFNSMAFLFLVILALAAAGAFVYYYLQYKEASATVAVKEVQLSTANSQVSTLNAKVTALQDDLAALNGTIAPVKSQLDLTLSQLKTANAYIDTVQSQIANATAQAASLKSENDKLLSIVRLNESSVKATSLTIHQNAGVVSSVVSFTAEYAGYVVISGTSSTPTGYVVVSDDNPNFPFSTNKYYFANGSLFSVPVLPGTIGVYFGNTEKENEFNATLSVTYYY
jgi:peptidoglycan hydrolase CwlO-like protein